MTGKHLSTLKAHLVKYQPCKDDISTPNVSRPSLERAAFMAMGRAAKALPDLPIQIEDITRSTSSPSEIQELVPEGALLAICEGPGERFGLVALSIEALTSVIEMQTYGRISSPHTEKRLPTRADASLSTGFINTLLAAIGKEASRLPEAGALSGFRFVAQTQSARSLDLILDDSSFITLCFRMGFGDGTLRHGQIIMALPMAVPADEKPDSSHMQPAMNEPEATGLPPPSSMEQSSSKVKEKLIEGSQVPIPLQAILYRKKVPLAELRALQAGSTITIPKAALEEARLETMDGMLLAKGKLGEDEGFHALRIKPASPEGCMVQDKQINTEPPINDLTEPDQFRPEPDNPPMADTSQLTKQDQEVRA